MKRSAISRDPSYRLTRSVPLARGEAGPERGARQDPGPRAALSRGCGPARFASLVSAEKAVAKGAEGTPYECRRGGLAHWHLKPPAPGPYIPPKVRRAVLRRDRWCCVCCGTSVIGRPYSLGHRVRAGQGGKAEEPNLITLLGLGGQLCHGRIDLYKNPDDAAKGYRLPSVTGGRPTDPAMFPVLVVFGDGTSESVYLTPDGRYAFGCPGRAA